MFAQPQRLTLFTTLLTLIAGAITPLAFAPLSWSPVAVLALCILIAVRRTLSPTHAALQGFLYGLALFGTGAHWIFYAIYIYGNATTLLSTLFTASFVIVLALFPALQGYVQVRFFSDRFFSFPATWTLQEGLRSWLFTGFPWLLIGHSQLHSPLSGWIPVFGELGVTFAVALTSTLIVEGLRARKLRYALAIIGLWCAGALLSLVHWSTPLAAPIKVALIQGNIPQEIKWDRHYLDNSLSTYFNLTRSHLHNDLIVWPEAAVPLALPQAQPFINAVRTLMDRHHALVLGIPLYNKGTDTFTNGLITLGDASGTYHKKHLVPFGEYVPFQKLIGPVFSFLDIPMSDLVEGPAHQILPTAFNIPFAPFICYEITYENLVRQDLPQAQFIVVINNDAWFGDSWGPWQQFEIAAFRALETGREVIFASNNGITALINARGHIQKSVPQFQQRVLEGTVQPYVGKTPWIRWGRWPMEVLCVVLLVISV